MPFAPINYLSNLDLFCVMKSIFRVGLNGTDGHRRAQIAQMAQMPNTDGTDEVDLAQMGQNRQISPISV